jgi:hypothetical protein
MRVLICTKALVVEELSIHLGFGGRLRNVTRMKAEEIKFGILLSALILVFAIPAWVPIVWNRQRWPKLRRPLIATTLSALVQLAFVNCVQTGLFTLDYSLRFAAAGIPCSILALVLGSKSNASSRARGTVIVSSSLPLLVRLFLITVH